MSALTPLFLMLGVVASAVLVLAIVANLAADLSDNARLKREKKIWKH